MQTEQARTLVLDQSYMPIGVVSWKDALTMFFTDKCEILSEYDGFVRSQLLIIKVPAVVRLLNAFRRHKKPVKFSRISVYGRDGYKCQYCGQKFRMNELTYDHVIPRAQGGKTTWENIVTCCISCNSRKGCRSPAQANMKLIKQPVQPSRTPSMVIQISKDSVPDAWRDFLYWTNDISEV